VIYSSKNLSLLRTIVDHTLCLPLTPLYRLRLDQLHLRGNTQDRMELVLDRVLQSLESLDLIREHFLAYLDPDFQVIERIDPVDYYKVMRLRTLDFQEHGFDLRREDVHSRISAYHRFVQ